MIYAAQRRQLMNTTTTTMQPNQLDYDHTKYV